MDRGRFHRVRQLFDDLADRPPAEADERLAVIATTDAELAQAVQRLLAHAQTTGGFDSLVPNAARELDLTPPRPLGEGDHVGDYEAVRRVGVGGMAEVWAVRHRRFGRLAALKVLTRAAPALRERLLLEGSAQARLQHPNLVPVREILDLQGWPALLMPLVRGPSLGALVARHRLERSQALGLFEGIVRGVAHAHRSGIIHRDLKPHNVLVDLSNGHLVPRVTDFGLVKELDQAGPTQTGMVMGTPAYASPEQLRDASHVDVRADLFSLGVILVELRTATLPFPGQTLGEILRAHEHGPRLDGLDQNEQALVASLLQLDPEDRPATIDAIETWLDEAREPRSASPELYAVAESLAFSELPRANTTPVHGSVHNLAAAKDSFVGRMSEVATLTNRLKGEGHRLWTLTGPGGTGKTRFAAEVVNALSGSWSSRWWIEATDARDESGLLAAVARGLGIVLGSGGAERIAEHLAELGSVLVVVDNLEQVAEVAARLLGEWLDGADGVTFVVTSRVPLRARGEQIVSVSPLSVEDARALFVQRAQAAGHPDVAAEDPAKLDELTAMLDRLPLAIELAAARTRMHDADALVSRLSERFRLLSGGGGDRPARQRTLRATLDWSWDLLSEAEKTVLAWSSVFEGGFSLDAACGVLEAGLPDDVSVDDILSGLLDHSLLVLDRNRGSNRFRMLVSVHDYATRRFGERPDHEQLDVLRRHATWYRELVRPSGLAAFESRQLVDVDEVDNLSAVVRRHREHGDDDAAGWCALYAADHHQQRGTLTAALRALADALADPLPPRLRVELLQARAECLLKVDDYQLALATLDELDALLDEVDAPPEWRADAMATRGSLLVTRLSRPDEGRALVEQSLAIRPRPRALAALGGMLKARGDIEGARELFTRAAELARNTGNRHDQLYSVYLAGAMRLVDWDVDGAIQRFEEARGLAEALDDRFRVGAAATQLSLCRVYRGDLSEARAQAQAALVIHQSNGERWGADQARMMLGHICYATGETTTALATFQGMLERYTAGSKRLMALHARLNIVEMLVERGSFDRAHEEVALAHADLRETDGVRIRVTALIHHGWLEVNRGRGEAALELVEQARSLGASGSAMMELYGAITEAWAHRQQQRWSDASAALEPCQSQVVARGVPFQIGMVMVERGRLERARDEHDAAEAAFETAEAAFERAGWVPRRAEAYLERTHDDPRAAVNTALAWLDGREPNHRTTALIERLREGT